MRSTMQQPISVPANTTESYFDQNGKPITREEAERLIRAIPGSHNAALGYTWTWGGLIKRLFGMEKTA